MAKQEYTFFGKAKWMQFLKPDRKYGDYRLSFYPADDATRKAIKATGTKCGVKEDDGSKGEPEGFYYAFKADKPFPVTDPQGNDITVPIGNGSDIQLTISVDDFVSPKFDPTARTRVESVVVTNLLKYDPPKKDAPKAATLPA